MVLRRQVNFVMSLRVKVRVQDGLREEEIRKLRRS